MFKFVEITKDHINEQENYIPRWARKKIKNGLVGLDSTKSPLAYTETSEQGKTQTLHKGGTKVKTKKLLNSAVFI